MSITPKEVREYHAGSRPGKTSVVPTKPCRTQRDLSLAYTPGVAIPCLDIQEDPSKTFLYTGKGNLVAVVSNGTAVLGLGNIGALAGKPVMEGKAVLFKRFADIDVFDLEVGSENPEDVIKFCQLLEPTVGGINLEDIKAPECFYIEETLRKTLSIPVMHDDQHGTAIISGAALLNALEIVNKPLDKVRVVFNGAGASAIASAEHYVRLGVKRENIVMVDTKGVIYAGRTEGMNPYKARFAHNTDLRTLAQALGRRRCVRWPFGKGRHDAGHVACHGPASGGVCDGQSGSRDYLRGCPGGTRKDVIMCTGRTDYPNQVNNVLGFPFIFRGALDVRATEINEEMKLAATRALAALAKEDVPDSVCHAYGVGRIRFGPDYIIPKPFDPRVLVWEASAVAKAAMETGVARQTVDLDEYRDRLERLLGKAHEVMRTVIRKAQAHATPGGFPGRRQRKSAARRAHPGRRKDRPAHPAGQCGHNPHQHGQAGPFAHRHGGRGPR